MDFVEKIKELAAQHLKDDSQFIVEVVASMKKVPNKLIVIIDGDKGVTIDDCALLSRKLSEALDNHQVLKDPYLLEVSTPGLDHPLKLKRQYYKNIGRSVRMKTVGGIVEGRLVSVADEMVTIEQQIGKGKKKEVKETTVPFAAIDKTFVLVSFK